MASIAFTTKVLESRHVLEKASGGELFNGAGEHTIAPNGVERVFVVDTPKFMRRPAATNKVFYWLRRDNFILVAVYANAMSAKLT